MGPDRAAPRPTAERSRARRPRLVATDLDGTLLRSDGSLSERTRAAVAAAEEAGIGVVFVTARPPRWLDGLATAIGGHGLAICGNGAFLYDVAARRVVEHHPLAPQAALAVVSRLRERVEGITFAAERVDGMIREDVFVLQREVLRDRVAADDVDLVSAGVGKLLARSDAMSAEAFHDRVAEALGPHGELAYSGAVGLAEITAPGVTKAAALARWAGRHGLAADEVWAFGDMPNDLPMLTWAGRAVAVANAHDDVLAVAHQVAPSNDHDGVAATIEAALAMPSGRPTEETE